VRPCRDAPCLDADPMIRRPLRSVIVTDPLSLAGLVLGATGSLAAWASNVRFRRLRRDCALLQSGSERSSFIVAAARTASELERLRFDVGRMHQEFDGFRNCVDESIRRVAVHRYDAFGEMGGRLSWSVALLDDHGDGVVLTTLVGRSASRAYAKPVRRGTPDATLSPEEAHVVTAALRPSRGIRIPEQADGAADASDRPTVHEVVAPTV
jgi:hypothetical protein